MPTSGFGDVKGVLPERVAVGNASLRVWPDQQTWTSVNDPRIACTHFADCATYHAELTAAVFAAKRDPRWRGTNALSIRGGCGHKVYDLPRWGAPAADLVHARALAFAGRWLAHEPVFADDTWCSIYRAGDYCMPHSHLRAEVSLVYMLETGDADAADRGAGRLCFNDARVAWCCPQEPGRATRVLVPHMPPGMLLLFDAAYLHSVNPYRGSHPRITLSWNVTRERLAGAARPSP